MEFAGKVAVVLGGASGIGGAASLALGRAGAIVLVCDRDAPAAERTAQEILGAGGHADAVGCDVTVAEDVAGLVRYVLKRHGHVDVLMHHVGRAIAGPLERIGVEQWRALFDTNVFAMVAVVNAFLPPMLARGSGRIVLTASSLGLFVDNPYATPYAATKGAVIAMGQGLAGYLQPFGIGVTIFCPDLVDTAFPRSVEFVGLAATPKLDVPPGAQTPEHAAELLISGLRRDALLVSTTPDAGAKFQALGERFFGEGDRA